MKWQKKGPANEQTEPPALSHAWLFGLFLVVATLIAYGPALPAGFVWDDDVYIKNDPLLTAPDGLRRIWFSLDSPAQYFPLTFTTFYMERGLWGLNPAGYHLVNILLHAANALLLWRVLTRLRVPGAWLAAAVFALHPVQVESVALISERKNVLMGLFFLLTLLAWIKFIDERCQRRWRFYVLALVFYGLALSAKTTACTLPAALLLILWLEKMAVNWRRLAQVAPFVAMGIGMGLVTVWWERHHQGAEGKLFEIGPMERVLIASRALWFYAGKLLWPANLTFSYPRWTISASDPRAYGWVLATAALGVVIWRVRRWTGRSVEVAAAFFAVTLSPLLGFIMLYTFVFSFVADHYQYLACIGPMALAAAGIEMGLGRIAAGKRVLQPALCAALLMTLGALTWKQSGMYADAETLWQTTLRRNPNSWMAQTNLGICFSQLGRMDEAIAHFQKALQIKPDIARAHYNLGLSFFQLGRLDEAILHYQKALEIQPDYPEAHNNLGVCLSQKGRLAEAIPHFQKELEIQPANASAQYNLGNGYFLLGRLDEAILHYQRALEIQPDYMEAQNNLAWLLATCPEASLRNGHKAVELAQQANMLDGGKNPVMLHTLAAAFAEAGRFSEAVETARHALRLAEAQSNTVLAGQLQSEMKLYEAGSPFHSPAQTH
jgi:tetratricopeptide (TPR) repeat protein